MRAQDLFTIFGHFAKKEELRQGQGACRGAVCRMAAAGVGGAYEARLERRHERRGVAAGEASSIQWIVGGYPCRRHKRRYDYAILSALPRMRLLALRLRQSDV